MTLGWILAGSFAGLTLSAALAAFALFLRASWLPMLFESGPPHQAAGAILAGIFGFFVLEKLLLWRHCHTENCEVHDRRAVAR